MAEHLHYARLFVGTEIIKGGGRIFPDDFWESRVMGIVNLDLECVDLTQSPVLKEFNAACTFSRNVMLRPWREEAKTGETLLQAIGRIAFEIGIPSLRVPSARDIHHCNRVVFPRRAHNPGLLVDKIGPVPEEFQRFR